MEVLQNSTNPKHRNCEMLKFLNKLNDGAMVIEGDTQLVEVPEKMKIFEAKEDERMVKELER